MLLNKLKDVIDQANIAQNNMDDPKIGGAL